MITFLSLGKILFSLIPYPNSLIGQTKRPNPPEKALGSIVKMSIFPNTRVPCKTSNPFQTLGVNRTRA